MLEVVGYTDDGEEIYQVTPEGRIYFDLQREARRQLAEKDYALVEVSPEAAEAIRHIYNALPAFSMADIARDLEMSESKVKNIIHRRGAYKQGSTPMKEVQPLNADLLRR